MAAIVGQAVTRLGYTVARTKAAEVQAFVALCDTRDLIASDLPARERAFLAHCARHLAASKSQLFQDLFVDFVMDGESGVFCEFGATDGVTLSNTHFLQNHRGWTGILAEPARQWHAMLRANRPAATIETRCVFTATGRTLQFSETPYGELSTISSYQDRDGLRAHRREQVTYDVETISLNDLLTQHGTERLDYLSIDTEGSELDILSAFDLARFRPRVITVEHNFTPARAALFALITGAGYKRMFEKYSLFDDWYVWED